MSAVSDGYSLRELVERFGGEVVGDADVRVRRVATLENAAPDAIGFLANERYARQVSGSRAAAFIVSTAARDLTDAARIVCSNPYVYFAHVSALFNPPRRAAPGIHTSAVVDESAQVHVTAEVGPCAVIAAGACIGAGSRIGAGCYVGEDATVGAECVLHPSAIVYEGCRVGDRTILHSGVIIGADGFGIAWDNDHWLKVPQVGRVLIGDDVEIGANTTVDRGAIDDTIIEDGVKLDNQIQVAHNVRIGAHTAIAACTGIAGSVQIGSHCRIGGGVGIAGHVQITDHVEISGHTAVTKSIDTPGGYTGVYPFEPNGKWRRNAAQLRHLADMARRLAQLEDSLEQLKRSQS